MSQDIHVYPINDTEEHDLESSTCHCSPYLEVVGGDLLVVHTAFDGRDVIEEAQELIAKLNGENLNVT